MDLLQLCCPFLVLRLQKESHGTQSDHPRCRAGITRAAERSGTRSPVGRSVHFLETGSRAALVVGHRGSISRQSTRRPSCGYFLYFLALRRLFTPWGAETTWSASPTNAIIPLTRRRSRSCRRATFQ